ncbi:MAG: tyrosine-type recombinase/integrase [Myxococcales bacterium]|nr:tyrosine-type recombinase/integrase [Myxococcales bacterium]
MELVNHYVTPDEGLRFERFLDWLARRGRSSSTARSYRSDWQHLAMWYRRRYGQLFDATMLDAEVTAAWRETAEARGKSGATVSRRLAFARTYGAFLSQQGVLRRSTVDAIRERARQRRVDRGPRVLSAEDVNTLLRHVDERGCLRDQAAFYLLLDTGLKVSEVVALTVGDVDFGVGSLRVEGTRDRVVPLPTRAARKLAWSLVERGLLALPPSGELVLPASGGWPPDHLVEPPAVELVPRMAEVPHSPMPFGHEGPPASWPLLVGERGQLSANGLQRIVRKHCTFARVDATPQVLRHTFAFAYWQRTRDLVSLAEILGHETIESSRMYTQIAPEAAAPAARLAAAGGPTPARVG